jgi:hypothetical protein
MAESSFAPVAGVFGTFFVAGTYLQWTAPVEVAATFAALLRINQRSACVGRVVTEALKPSESSTPKTTSK